MTTSVRNMDLTSLPDDALLEVLGYLDTKELLQCRGVCHRLRDAALHPDLWQHRSLSLENGCVQLAGAALSLAPCLDSLSLDYDEDETNLQLASLLVSTNCAVSKLKFVLDDTCSSALAVMVLARQASLGRLRTVFVQPFCGNANLRMLLDQILYTRGLTSIELLVEEIDEEINLSPGPGLPKAAKGDATPASLRRFKYNMQDSTLPSYLRWHADTLQEVLLGLKVEPPAGTGALLAALPRLRQLECQLLDDMPALLHCPALESLHLHVDVNASTRPFLPGVVEYLREAVATRLQSLVLQFDTQDPSLYADQDDLLLKFAGPGRGAAALRSLRLKHGILFFKYAWEPQPQLLPLARVLGRLYNLERLDLGGPHTTRFLEAMDGRVLPRLERLDVFLKSEWNVEGWGGGCPHEWAHGDEPRALLRRYPRLHLVVRLNHDSRCPDCTYTGCEVCKCAYCEANTCHRFGHEAYVLSSHLDHHLCSKKLLKFHEFYVDC